MNLLPEDIARCERIRSPEAGILEVVYAVADQTGVSINEILGDRRWANVVAARHLVYFIADREGYTLAAIGRAVGGRDHTTIIHGINAKKRRRGNA
jgi:chromosomal replication initiation ATPase DnaA